MVTFNWNQYYNEWEIARNPPQRGDRCHHLQLHELHTRGNESYLVETGIRCPCRHSVSGRIGSILTQPKIYDPWRDWPERVRKQRQQQLPYQQYGDVDTPVHFGRAKKSVPEKWAEQGLAEAETDRPENVVARMYYPYDEELGVCPA